MTDINYNENIVMLLKNCSSNATRVGNNCVCAQGFTSVIDPDTDNLSCVQQTGVTQFSNVPTKSKNQIMKYQKITSKNNINSNTLFNYIGNNISFYLNKIF